MNDPFPESELAPLTSEALEAGAVRVAICSPEHARELNPDRDLTIRVLRETARAALDAYGRGEAWSTDFLFRLDGVPWAEAVDAYLWHGLDDPELVNPATVRECRRLSKWRELRDLLLRGAMACEEQDMAAVLGSLDAVNAVAPRAKIVRAA